MMRPLLTLFVLFAAAFGAAAQQGAVARSDVPPLASSSGAFTASTNAIIGTARDAGNGVLPDAAVQLRDLRNGVIVSSARTNAEGQFAFRSLEPGTYVVELITAEGLTVALSEAVTVGTGEIVQTLVRLAGRSRTFGWWMGSTTSTALSSASSLGVLSLDEGAAVSPQQ